MDEITVECKLARNYTMENTPDALAYLLIKVVPNPSVDFGSIPMNIGLVIDVSASMRGKKIKSAIEAAKVVVQSLRPDDWVSVTAFSDDTRVIVPATQAFDKFSILSEIDKLRIRSGTRMYLGMEVGVREMRNARFSGSINRMIILTDGETEGEDRCQSIAEQEADNKLVISNFGIGDRYNEELLKELSDTTLGSFYHLKFAQEIQDSFQKEIDAVSAAVITNVGLSLNVPKGLKLDSISRIFPSSVRLQPKTEADGTVFSVQAGNLRKDESTCFGAQLRLPARPAGRVRIAQVYITYNVPSLQIEDRVEKRDVIVQYSADPTLCGMVDREVIAYFNQLNAQTLIEQAVRETKAGNVAAATQSLIQAQALTERIGNVNLTRSIEGAIQELKEKGTISSGGIKTVKAGSRQTVTIDETEFV